MTDFDSNKDIPLSELLKKHGGFTQVVEKSDWFDPEAKPRKNKSDATFEPKEIPEEKDGDVSLPE